MEEKGISHLPVELPLMALNPWLIGPWITVWGL